MTDGRTMPGTEIKHSGGWFYESTGGTLAMSRGLFWDRFMVSKFQDAHVNAVELSAAIIDEIASDYFEGKAWCLDDSKSSHATMYALDKDWGDVAFAANYKSSAVKHYNKEASPMVKLWSCPRCTVQTLAEPATHRGEINIQQDVDISWVEGGELFGLFNATPGAPPTEVLNVSIKGSLQLTVCTTISFKAVSSTGELQFDSTTAVTRKDYEDMEVSLDGIGQQPDSVHKMIEQWAAAMMANYKTLQDSIEERVKDIDSLFSEVAAALEDDLNKQNKSVFPGSGPFDMKDPIFSDKGDLMIGLTYR